MFMEDKMPVIALIIGVLLAATDQIIKYFVLTYLQPVGSVTAIDRLKIGKHKIFYYLISGS